jgi:RNA polymerase sigma-70 factor (ECF subfamily)
VFYSRDREQCSDDDAQLIVRVGEGDADAYRELVRRHAGRLHQFVLRLVRNEADAEDVVQDTFLRLWLRAVQFVPSASGATWLHRIAHNLALDRVRSRRRVDEFQDDLELPQSNTAPQLALLDAKRNAEALYRALDTLPVRQAAALVLVHLNGLSGNEACEVMGISDTQLESLLARGRRNLKVRVLELPISEPGES